MDVDQPAAPARSARSTDAARCSRPCVCIARRREARASSAAWPLFSPTEPVLGRRVLYNAINHAVVTITQLSAAASRLANLFVVVAIGAGRGVRKLDRVFFRSVRRAELFDVASRVRGRRPAPAPARPTRAAGRRVSVLHHRARRHRAAPREVEVAAASTSSNLCRWLRSRLWFVRLKTTNSAPFVWCADGARCCVPHCGRLRLVCFDMRAVHARGPRGRTTTVWYPAVTF